MRHIHRSTHNPQPLNTPRATSSYNTADHWLLRYRRWLIIAMLVSLHFALMTHGDTWISRGWLLVHFGLFLIWQPFVSADRELNVIAVSLLLGITAVVLYSVAGWMLATWLALLIAIMGGKVFYLASGAAQPFLFSGGGISVCDFAILDRAGVNAGNWQRVAARRRAPTGGHFCAHGVAGDDIFAISRGRRAYDAGIRFFLFYFCVSTRCRAGAR